MRNLLNPDGVTGSGVETGGADAAAIAAKHGASAIPAADRPAPILTPTGRHAKYCQCGACPRKTVSLNPGMAPAPGKVAPVNQAVPVAPIDPEAVKQGVMSVLTMLDDAITGAIENEAHAVSKDATFAAKMAEKVKLREENRQMMGTMSAKVCEKYQILGQYAPELFLLVGLGTWALPVVTTVRELRRLKLKLSEAAEKAAKVKTETKV